MFDSIGFLTLGAMFLLFVTVLAIFARATPISRTLAAIAALLWGGAVVAIANAGGFGPGAAGPVPGVGYAVALALAAGLGAWIFAPGFRSALLSVPMPVLVATNLGRVFGGFFLLLASAGRLSAPFAPVAGWGDVAVGALAPFVVVLAVRSTSYAAIGIWNALGALDLIVALTLGVLSAPGTPFRVFTDEPGTLVIGELPWAMIPALLVPLWLLVHLTIAVKLRTDVEPRRKRSVA